jgi:RNA polymerase sigma-54 factor
VTDDFSYIRVSEETFAEMLHRQIGAIKLTEGFAELCHYIVDCLNSRGYLEIATSVLALEIGCSEYEILQALYVVQSLQPTGVGARTLTECLMLQLAESRHFNGHTIKLVKDGLELLAANDVRGVTGLLHVGPDEVLETMRVVKELNPIPSQGYNTGQKSQTVLPDAVIRQENGKITVKINRLSIPQLSLNREYYKLIGSTDDEKAEKYLQENLGAAKTFIKAVEQRIDTLTRVINCIIEIQKVFFKTGQGLVPMNMAEIADALELHTSTISRAVQEKYVVCAAGTVSLKSLFAKGVRGVTGQIISTDAIKQQIARIIGKEDASRPLSDEALRQALQACGTDISRRTVMKYREELGFASSAMRRTN